MGYRLSFPNGTFGNEHGHTSKERRLRLLNLLVTVIFGRGALMAAPAAILLAAFFSFLCMWFIEAESV
jgi:hypothetical protein